MELLNLTEIRKKAGLNLTDLADSLGVSAASVSMWETGKRSPTLKKLMCLTKALGVTPNDLLGVDEGKVKQSAK